MSKVPSLNYDRVVKALERNGFDVIRQKGSHIRMEKRLENEIIKITVPTHKPIKRSTLSHILKQAKIKAEDFMLLL